MSGPGTTPLFVDTGAFFAHFVEDASRHDRARHVFNQIRDGDLLYRPLYTSGYVLSELGTLILRRSGHQTALEALTRIRESPAFTVLYPGEDVFDPTLEQFAAYDDQQISIVDHMSAVLAAERDVDHVFTFDARDFRTLGFTVVPDDTGDA